MRIYMIDVFDNNWKLINRDFYECEDRQQAELEAEKTADWLGFEKWEITRIR